MASTVAGTGRALGGHCCRGAQFAALSSFWVAGQNLRQLYVFFWTAREAQLVSAARCRRGPGIRVCDMFRLHGYLFGGKCVSVPCPRLARAPPELLVGRSHPATTVPAQCPPSARHSARHSARLFFLTQTMPCEFKRIRTEPYTNYFKCSQSLSWL